MKEELVYILKTLVTALPIPYSSNIELLCSGENAQVLFTVSGTLDKNENVLDGMDPALNNIEFSVNASNFKLPIQGGYTCKISFQTYTYNDLLLLNLSKN